MGGSEAKGKELACQMEKEELKTQEKESKVGQLRLPWLFPLQITILTFSGRSTYPDIHVHVGQIAHLCRANR